MPHALALCILSESAKSVDKTQITSDLISFLKTLNAAMEHHEQISKLVILSEEWTIENGALTPTLKIKRNIIDCKYQNKYGGWSNAKEMVIFND
jgi:long-subunit acyl-CoA synthetase (AMP-forming)